MKPRNGIRRYVLCGSALVSAIAMLGVVPAAGADTFCVSRPGCADPGHNFTTIQQAVNAADANNPPSPPATPDLILVGHGVFHEAVTDGADNPVDIVGSGPRTGSDGTLIERDAGNSVRTVSLGVALGGRASTVQDVTIQVPSGTENTGLQAAGDADNVVVTAATSPSPTNSVGISVNGNGPTTVRKAKVDLPGAAVGVRLHLANLKDSSVKASTGLQGDGTVHGSTIDANLGAQTTALKLEDCVMRISGANGVALSAVGIGVNVFNQVTARHVTVIGDSDPTSLAVRAEAEGSAASDNSADVDIRSSILRGFAKNFKRSATNAGGHTGTANITVAYSDYDSSIPVDDNGGPGTFNETTPGGNTSASPGFRSASDLHLASSSALIDAGDPASPESTGFPPDATVDFDGLPRKTDGNGDGAARADIGAFEFQLKPPGPGPGGGRPGVEPSNEFSFGKVKKNKRKGIAKLTVIVPGPGDLELAKTKKVKADDEAVEGQGATEDKLLIKPKGKSRKRLNKKGKAKVKAEVTYTPTRGASNTQDKKVKLVKK